MHERAEIWLFNQFLPGSPEAALKAPAMRAGFTEHYHEGALKSYSAVVQFLQTRYVSDDNTKELDVEMRNIRQGSMSLTEYAQEHWLKTLSC